MAQEVSTVKESLVILLISFIGFLLAAMHYLYNLLARTANPSDEPPVHLDFARRTFVGEEVDPSCEPRVDPPTAAHWTTEPEVLNDFCDESMDPPSSLVCSGIWTSSRYLHRLGCSKAIGGMF
ncbi:unnamed protein product [Calypogeia fissa]